MNNQQDNRYIIQGGLYLPQPMAKKIQDTTQKGSPLKRHEALIPFSKDHHFVLLLSWKIRRGRQMNIEQARIVNYVNYFFRTQLATHMMAEETYLLPLLPDRDPMKLEIIAHHERLRELFNHLYLNTANTGYTLDAIEEELEAHIRFEERTFFPYVQAQLSQDKLAALAKQLNDSKEPIIDSWEDPYWA